MQSMGVGLKVAGAYRSGELKPIDPAPTHHVPVCDLDPKVIHDGSFWASTRARARPRPSSMRTTSSTSPSNSHGKIPLPQADEPAPTAELDNQTHGQNQGKTTDISKACRVILPQHFSVGGSGDHTSFKAPASDFTGIRARGALYLS